MAQQQGADWNSFIDLWLSPLPTVLLHLPTAPSLQFWHPIERIYLHLWKLMEICRKGFLLWAHVTTSRVAGWSAGTNFKVTSFRELLFQTLFLDQAARPATGQRSVPVSSQSLHLTYKTHILFSVVARWHTPNRRLSSIFMGFGVFPMPVYAAQFVKPCGKFDILGYQNKTWLLTWQQVDIIFP